jgi:YVTN family beta-propeller protein
MSSGESFMKVATIELTGASAPKWMAMNPTGTKLYVADEGVNKVFVINTATNTVEAAVSVCTGPKGMAFSTDASMLFVATPGSADIGIIDTLTNVKVGDIAVGTTNFSNLAYGDLYGQLLIANTGLNSIEVLDNPVNGASITSSIPVPMPYQIVAYTPTTELSQNAYTTSFDGAGLYLSEVNVNTKTIEHTWESSASKVSSSGTGKGFRGLVISPDKKKLYAADHDYSYIDSMGITTTVNTLEPINFMSVATDDVPSPDQIAMYSNGKYLAVLNTYNTCEVVLLDTATRKRVGAYALPSSGYYGIAYKP